MVAATRTPAQLLVNGCAVRANGAGMRRKVEFPNTSLHAGGPELGDDQPDVRYVDAAVRPLAVRGAVEGGVILRRWGRVGERVDVRRPEAAEALHHSSDVADGDHLVSLVGGVRGVEEVPEVLGVAGRAGACLLFSSVYAAVQVPVAYRGRVYRAPVRRAVVRPVLRLHYHGELQRVVSTQRFQRHDEGEGILVEEGDGERVLAGRRLGDPTTGDTAIKEEPSEDGYQQAGATLHVRLHLGAEAGRLGTIVVRIAKESGGGIGVRIEVNDRLDCFLGPG